MLKPRQMTTPPRNSVNIPMRGDMVYCVGCGEIDRVSKASNRRVLWEKGSSRVIEVLNAWKDVVSQIRGNCYNEELEQVFGFFVLALLSSIQELLGQKATST